MKELIQYVKQINQNWEKDEYSAPSEEVVNKAVQFLNIFEQLNITPSHVSSTCEEGIGITFQKEEKFAYVEILNAGYVQFFADINGQNMNYWDVGLLENNDIENSFNQIKEHLTKDVK